MSDRPIPPTELPPFPGWVSPDVLVDDLRAWADRGREFGLSRCTIRRMRRIGDAIERATSKAAT